ncbi:beta-1,4-glucuronyltransferase 1 [Caerostris extrusa]|uniref:Beta-1,4-glucuronyltransferase 1 n=1 Tax=Caerostris extrusa TaxID=172846 RepID=A0AAV4P8R7_CAEEX|nr:beta-1,4-glucuronyltransferase 1 [Caerostris extrusa]
MRQRCRLICSRSSLYIYVTAIALFTLCNILAIILISRSYKQSDQPIAKINADESFFLPQDGGLLIGNLLSTFAFNFNQSSSRTDSKRTYHSRFSCCWQCVRKPWQVLLCHIGHTVFSRQTPHAVRTLPTSGGHPCPSQYLFLGGLLHCESVHRVPQTVLASY